MIDIIMWQCIDFGVFIKSTLSLRIYLYFTNYKMIGIQQQQQVISLKFQTNMQRKLNELRRKQNDIGEYERRKMKVKIEMQQYNQDVNYTQARFFGDCAQQLKSIAADAYKQQKVLRERQRIVMIKQAEQQQQHIDEPTRMLILNIVIDYLRSQNMNYTYSVITRERNIISEDIVMRSDLAHILRLGQQLERDCRFDVSVLELMLRKLDRYHEECRRKQITTKELAIQCELINSFSQPNNVLLTELKLQQIRNETEQRERKYFESQLHLFKSQQLLQLKSQMSKLLQIKTQQITQSYQTKIQSLIGQKSQLQPNTQTLQQYLIEINRLKQEIRQLREKCLKYQREKLQHDCLLNQHVKNLIQQTQKERQQLNQLKLQFDLALRNMGTRVEDLAFQKQKIMNSNKRQTQQYLSKMKTYKQNKDYMIDKVYSTLRNFQLRIDNLSSDNNKLYQQNHILRNQIAVMRTVNQGQVQKQQQAKKHLALSELKLPTKNASIGVTPEQLQPPKELQQSKSLSEISDLTYTSEEFQDRLRSKAEQNQKINNLKLQMSLLKNKVKYLVMDFQ